MRKLLKDSYLRSMLIINLCRMIGLQFIYVNFVKNQ